MFICYTFLFHAIIRSYHRLRKVIISCFQNDAVLEKNMYAVYMG